MQNHKFDFKIFSCRENPERILSPKKVKIKTKKLLNVLPKYKRGKAAGIKNASITNLIESEFLRKKQTHDHLLGLAVVSCRDCASF